MESLHDCEMGCDALHKTDALLRSLQYIFSMELVSGCVKVELALNNWQAALQAVQSLAPPLTGAVSRDNVIVLTVTVHWVAPRQCMLDDSTVVRA